jgi:hypothetical protein
VLGVIVIFLGIAIAPSINANINNKSELVQCKPKSSVMNMDNESIYHFCYLKSGYVNHENVNISGFYTENLPFSFCIGNVDLDLINFLGEPKGIKVTFLSLSGIIIIKDNVSLSLTGFIGFVCPTGSVNSGRLQGFALTTIIKPFEGKEK